MKTLAPVMTLLALLTSACGSHISRASGKRVIVLGIDGMDPNFIERHWDSLPNLRRLRDRGGFSRLATTNPPQSPVAWSTFSTGLDPAQHGVFDFVHRDPATLQPLSSFAEALPPAHILTLGPYLLPLSKGSVHSFRTGKTFWEILANRGIPVKIIRMPANYPPIEGAGEQLAGMGTPDLEGTFGTFTFYTGDPLDTARNVPGGRIVPITSTNGRVILSIEGPPNSLRRGHAQVNRDLIADVDSQAGAARFQIDNRQFILKEGEWSPWIRVRFPLIDHLASAAGIFRLYAQQLRNGIRIYRTPINADPSDSPLPISAPAIFARDIATRIGPFYTQGIEEDTAALRQGVFTLRDYLQQSRMVHAEHEALLKDALNRYHDGLLFFYFSEIDQDSHMLWGRHEAQLLDTYRAVDHSIGEVLAQTGDATIMVMSDHGFAAFDYAVNLNTWLQREGFLSLKTGDRAIIDWKHTQAYAMGLNALYINLAGREKYGVVSHAERETVLAELIPRLRAWKPVILSIERVPATSSRFAPDLIVGYAPGYRASWETGLGDVPPEVLHANDDAWIGDHCMAPEAVPGVLLGTRKLRVSDPRLKDLTVTILAEFGVAPASGMDGRPVY